jgi:23S rRNA (pseudouridine1915-N3)-methyltransferase
MMKIKIYCIGKLKEKYFVDAQKEYQKRLERFAKLEIIELNDLPIPVNASNKEEELLKEKEFDLLLSKIDKNYHIIALDLDGKAYDSIEFSNRIDTLMNNSITNIAFVIGGSLGFSKRINEFSKEKLRLSNMTFTHQMTRIILLEQIYRSFKILKNETYHK